jgi:hypothetical protein
VVVKKALFLFFRPVVAGEKRDRAEKKYQKNTHKNQIFHVLFPLLSKEKAL